MERVWTLCVLGGGTGEERVESGRGVVGELGGSGGSGGLDGAWMYNIRMSTGIGLAEVTI